MSTRPPNPTPAASPLVVLPFGWRGIAAGQRSVPLATGYRDAGWGWAAWRMEFAGEVASLAAVLDAPIEGALDLVVTVNGAPRAPLRLTLRGESRKALVVPPGAASFESGDVLGCRAGTSHDFGGAPELAVRVGAALRLGAVQEGGSR